MCEEDTSVKCAIATTSSNHNNDNNNNNISNNNKSSSNSNSMRNSHNIAHMLAVVSLNSTSGSRSRSHSGSSRSHRRSRRAYCMAAQSASPASSAALAATHSFRITSGGQMMRPHATLLIIVGCCCLLAAHTQAVGYSYTRFEGPVAGPEQQILVHDAFGAGTRADYVARPEYSFAYGVEDAKTHVLQNRKETRDGDAVKGVYSVVDPDGTLRVVKYTADDVHGFQAEVITNGVATLHGHGAANEQQAQQHGGHADGGVVDNDSRAHYEVHEDNDEDVDANGVGDHDDDDHGDDDADDDDDNVGHGHKHNSNAGSEADEEERAEEYDGSSEEGYEEAANASDEVEDY